PARTGTSVRRSTSSPGLSPPRRPRRGGAMRGISGVPPPAPPRRAGTLMFHVEHFSKRLETTPHPTEAGRSAPDPPTRRTRSRSYPAYRWTGRSPGSPTVPQDGTGVPPPPGSAAAAAAGASGAASKPPPPAPDGGHSSLLSPPAGPAEAAQAPSQPPPGP